MLPCQRADLLSIVPPQFLQVMGYVPQDDVMLADMTVEELLHFSARVRLPAAARPADHLRHVDRTIKVCS